MVADKKKDAIYKILVDPKNPGLFRKEASRHRLTKVFLLFVMTNTQFAVAKVIAYVLWLTINRKVVAGRKEIQVWHRLSTRDFLNKMEMSNTGQVSAAIESAVSSRWLRRRNATEKLKKGAFEYSLGERFFEPLMPDDDDEQ